MPRGKGEGSVYKRKSDGLWCVRIELPRGLDGRRRTKVVCRKDKRQAMAAIEEFKEALKKYGNIPTSSLTVGRWLRYWIDEILPGEKIRPSSIAAYKSTVDGWLIPLLGRHRIDTLSADHVREMFRAIMSTPKSPKLRGQKDLPAGTVMVGPDTAIKAHAVLSSALKTAMREGKATRNVCEMVDPPRKAKTVQGSLTAEQARTLLQHLATRKDCALWSTYLLTGARRGEILGLEAERVTEVLDLSWQLLRITDIKTASPDYEYRHLHASVYLTRPKSRSGARFVPLVEPLRSILALHMQGQTTGLVFTKEDGTPWDPDSATRAWAKLLKDAGLPSNVVLHGARHSAIEMMSAAGVDWDTIKDIVGHSTIQMSMDYRSKPDQKRLTAAMEQTARMLR